jgi:flagellar biosynthesis/type III secretory pathway protein FliH
LTFHLAHADGTTLLTSDRAVIKRRVRVAFGDALTLLRETTTLCDKARADADSAREAARREGLDEARLAAHEAVATGLADITTAIDAHAEARRADIADAAFAAARAIIGEMDDTDVMQRIVDRTLARLDGDKPVTIEVAPALVDALTRHTDGLTRVTVSENPDFAPTDCRIHSAQGQIVASLSVQFDALAARWGLKKDKA